MNKTSTTNTTKTTSFIKTFSNNDIIVSEGEIGHNFYLIQSGKVKIIKIGSENKLKTVEILEAGSIFGEMAILEKVPRSATVMAAANNTKILELNKNNFKNMFFEHTETLIQLIQLIAKRIWHTQCRIEILETENKNLKFFKMLNFLTDDQARKIKSLPDSKYSIFIPDALHIMMEWTNIPQEEIEKSFKDLEHAGIVMYDAPFQKLYVNNVDEIRKRFRRAYNSTKFESGENFD